MTEIVVREVELFPVLAISRDTQGASEGELADVPEGLLQKLEHHQRELKRVEDLVIEHIRKTGQKPESLAEMLLEPSEP